MRGDYSCTRSRRRLFLGTPPLARGIQSRTVAKDKMIGTTPACAGNTRSQYPWGALTWEHPRLRGEYLPVHGSEPPGSGTPPLARGIHVWPTDRRQAYGNTPACAGNTIQHTSYITQIWEHPRLRGEYRAARRALISSCGPPPLARGIPIGNRPGNVETRTTPPRLRGEYIC